MEGEEKGFPARLEAALGEQSVYAFAKKSGITESLLRKYLAGASQPGMDKLATIAQATGTRLDWLVLGEGQRSAPRTEPPGPRPKARSAGDAARGIPVVGSIAAGALVERYTSEHAEPHVRIDAGSLARPSDLLFGLRISGRSMEQWMFEGDVAICSATQEARRGDDVCVYQFSTGESTVKRLERIDRRARRIDLRPVNPAYRSFTMTLEENDQVKKIVGLWRDYRLVERRRAE